MQGLALRNMAMWDPQAHKPDELKGNYSQGRRILSVLKGFLIRLF